MSQKATEKSFLNTLLKLCLLSICLLLVIGCDKDEDDDTDVFGQLV